MWKCTNSDSILSSQSTGPSTQCEACPAQGVHTCVYRDQRAQCSWSICVLGSQKTQKIGNRVDLEIQYSLVGQFTSWTLYAKTAKIGKLKKKQLFISQPQFVFHYMKLVKAILVPIYQKVGTKLNIIFGEIGARWCCNLSAVMWKFNQ